MLINIILTFQALSHIILISTQVTSRYRDPQLYVSEN